MAIINKKEEPAKEAKPVEAPKQSVVETPAPIGNCPDCKGLGLRNPAIDRYVCQTCQGTGNI